VAEAWVPFPGIPHSHAFDGMNRAAFFRPLSVPCCSRLERPWWHPYRVGGPSISPSTRAILGDPCIRLAIVNLAGIPSIVYVSSGWMFVLFQMAHPYCRALTLALMTLR